MFTVDHKKDSREFIEFPVLEFRMVNVVGNNVNALIHIEMTNLFHNKSH